MRELQENGAAGLRVPDGLSVPRNRWVAVGCSVLSVCFLCLCAASCRRNESSSRSVQGEVVVEFPGDTTGITISFSCTSHYAKATLSAHGPTGDVADIVLAEGSPARLVLDLDSRDTNDNVYCLELGGYPLGVLYHDGQQTVVYNGVRVPVLPLWKKLGQMNRSFQVRRRDAKRFFDKLPSEAGSNQVGATGQQAEATQTKFREEQSLFIGSQTESEASEHWLVMSEIVEQSSPFLLQEWLGLQQTILTNTTAIYSTEELQRSASHQFAIYSGGGKVEPFRPWLEDCKRRGAFKDPDVVSTVEMALDDMRRQVVWALRAEGQTLDDKTGSDAKSQAE